MRLFLSSAQVDVYEVGSLLLNHYKETKEIGVVNTDTGKEFLVATDYEEAEELAKLILKLVTGPFDNRDE
jgi:hypothetical protein